MELTLDHPGDYLFIRRVSPTGITVVDRELTRSFLLAPERAVENWAVTAVAQLDETHAAEILALAPELVLLGSGPHQTFPPDLFMAAVLRHGIGLEVMDNAAAARTYSLLSAERRRVVVAFIL